MADKNTKELEARIARLEKALATQMMTDYSRRFSTWEYVGRRNGMGATTARNFVAKTLAPKDGE